MARLRAPYVPQMSHRLNSPACLFFTVVLPYISISPNGVVLFGLSLRFEKRRCTVWNSCVSRKLSLACPRPSHPDGSCSCGATVLPATHGGDPASGHRNGVTAWHGDSTQPTFTVSGSTFHCVSKLFLLPVSNAVNACFCTRFLPHKQPLFWSVLANEAATSHAGRLRIKPLKPILKVNNIKNSVPPSHGPHSECSGATPVR